MPSNISNIQKNFKQEIPHVYFYWNYEIAFLYVTSIVFSLFLFLNKQEMVSYLHTRINVDCYEFISDKT